MRSLASRHPAGFQYDFRPATYFDNLEPNALIVASILGEERRRAVKEALQSDPLAHLPLAFTDSQLDPPTRERRGAVHPALLGGEYLPTLGQDTIEIARIVFASMTQDVISVRAQRTRGRIRYHVQDEYDTEFRQRRHATTLPLSLGELIQLIDTTKHPDPVAPGGLVWSHVRWHVREGFLDEARSLVSVESEFYTELGSYYDRVIAEYVDAKEDRRGASANDRRRARRPSPNLTLDFSGEEPGTGKAGGRQ